jgi:hypothetical protein
MKRYEVVVAKPQYTSKYYIQDNSSDHTICRCDSSEDADLIVKAMNALYKGVMKHA